MRTGKIAEFNEHNHIEMNEVYFESGHGLLPSNCVECNGPLDFIRKNNKTILQCRNCKNEYDE